MSISKTYLQDAILNNPLVLKPIDDNRDFWERFNDPEAPARSEDEYICDIEGIMQNAIRKIDSATGNEIVMLLNTYNHIVQRLNSERKWFKADLSGTIQECLDTVTRDLANID